jgi:hypothetical protein
VTDKLTRSEALRPGTGSNLTTTERFGFNVAEQPDRIQLAPQPGALSARQVEAVSELARRWREDGRGVVRIETPRRRPERHGRQPGGQRRGSGAAGRGRARHRHRPERLQRHGPGGARPSPSGSPG